MRALGLIAIGGVLGSVGLAMLVGLADSAAGKILGGLLLLAGCGVGIVGLLQNHRDHTAARR